MIIFCYSKSTKCYGDTVIRRYTQCANATASQRHSVTASHRV